MIDKPVIGCDIDDTVLDLVPAWLEEHAARTGEVLIPETLQSWGFAEYSNHGEALYDILKDPTLYDMVQPVPGALEGLRLLRQSYRVIFITANADPSLSSKTQCLIRHGLVSADTAHKEVFVMPDKTLANVEVLIDDKAETINAFKGPGILVERPWNSWWKPDRARQYPVVRCGNWESIPSFVDVLIDYSTGKASGKW